MRCSPRVCPGYALPSAGYADHLCAALMSMPLCAAHSVSMPWLCAAFFKVCHLCAAHSVSMPLCAATAACHHVLPPAGVCHIGSSRRTCQAVSAGARLGNSSAVVRVAISAGGGRLCGGAVLARAAGLRARPPFRRTAPTPSGGRTRRRNRRTPLYCRGPWHATTRSTGHQWPSS